jgi:hypothetical protein
MSGSPFGSFIGYIEYPALSRLLESTPFNMGKELAFTSNAVISLAFTTMSALEVDTGSKLDNFFVGLRKKPTYPHSPPPARFFVALIFTAGLLFTYFTNWMRSAWFVL